ncbi:PIN domain-containing protein [Bradyrhizobium canariense]|uniref:Ribonuclease VapC n=1 Tax=Bradyrhizobium canariense TaxID=255045 RepID=A0A1H1RM79_9BRAD|nr:PIN domain-containing protein [Bradyrhizobium canariense]SDS36815.1 Predicted nucleic acid-binding protein, contains PIN domain [Bradyrhizobium canariense]
MPGSFFDTNILIYIASSDPIKADHAEAIIGNGGAISVQVLNELANVARRKMRMSWQDTHAFLSLLRGLLVVHPVAVETHDTGLALAERYNLSIYDAMIAASALHADCDTLWSEDMQHGMVLDGRLRIVSPFSTTR